MAKAREIWLAPLRGVTIRAFREVFAAPIREAGFTRMVAPFIPANPGIRVNDRLLADLLPFPPAVDDGRLAVVPQVISRHPEAMRELLKGLKARGFDRADLNAGCPFPMIVKRGRGSGLFRTPDILDKLLDVGCEEMGPGKFSVKTRLGLTRADELLELLPLYNRYPLAALTVHARTAKQMYSGECDLSGFREVARASVNPVVYNGDARSEDWERRLSEGAAALMVGRSFIRSLGARDDAAELLQRYIERSQGELCGDRPVLGRMKELLTYWAEGSPKWRRRWPMVKICRSVEELRQLI